MWQTFILLQKLEYSISFVHWPAIQIL